MKIKDITSAIEEFAPLSLQEKWDNSGLLIGSPGDDCTGVLIALDCTRAVVEAALECGASMVLTHHPLIFGGLRRISQEDPVGEAVIAAVRGGVAVYAAHTNADKASGGVSWAMASRLGLRNVAVLDDEGSGTGLGVVGDLPVPLSGEDAVAAVKMAFGVPSVRCSAPVRQVRRVALCGGSGSSEIEAAMKAGADLYVSGDISYHHFFTPEGFMLADIGHFESEVDITGVFYNILTKKFPNFAVRIYGGLPESNPVFYR